MDVGESIEQTAVREAFEETNLIVRLIGILGVYSIPSRDPRRHTITTTFLAEATNPSNIRGSDDAAIASWFSIGNIPNLVFDHSKMINDFMEYLRGVRTIASITYPETIFTPQGIPC